MNGMPWSWHVKYSTWGNATVRSHSYVRGPEIPKVWKLLEPQIRNNPEAKGAT